MSRHIPNAEGHEKLVANRFGVATQGIPIATRTRLLHHNFVSIESKKELRNHVATKSNRLRQRPAIMTENSIATKLSRSRQSDQFGPNFWGSTMQLMKCDPTLESL